MRRIYILIFFLLFLSMLTARAQQVLEIYRTEADLVSHYDEAIADLRQRINALKQRIADNEKEIQESDIGRDILTAKKDIEICEIDIARFEEMIKRYQSECRQEVQAFRDRQNRVKELAEKLKREEEAKIKAQKKLEQEQKKKAEKAKADEKKKQQAAIQAERKRKQDEANRIRMEEEKRRREEIERKKAIKREQVRQDRMAQTNPRYSSKKDQARSRAEGESSMGVANATRIDNYIDPGRHVVGDTPPAHNKSERESLRDIVQKKKESNAGQLDGEKLFQDYLDGKKLSAEEQKAAEDWLSSQTF